MSAFDQSVLRNGLISCCGTDNNQNCKDKQRDSQKSPILNHKLGHVLLTKAVQMHLDSGQRRGDRPLSSAQTLLLAVNAALWSGERELFPG